jgi:membrane fusion protein, multidrug efflux system
MKTIITILVLVGILLGAKFLFFPSQSLSNEKKGGLVFGGVATNVAVYIVKAEKLSNKVYASGTILANEEVALQSELSGKITRLNFQEGGKVSKGQLLVKINDADLQANYKKLQLQHSLAEERMQRQEKLLVISGISQEEFDISKNQTNVIKVEMEFEMAQIAKTEIRAPFDGIIGLKKVSDGAYVTPTVTIATIQQINPIKIDFSISERYANSVKKGDELLFILDGNQQEIKGEVYAIEPKIDMATRTVQIRAICTNSQNDIYPGAFAKVQLDLGDIDKAIMIPTETIVPDLKGKKVYRIKNGLAEFITVITGLRTDSEIQIEEGLSIGDTIITKGIMQLKPGSAVKITEIK